MQHKKVGSSPVKTAPAKLGKVVGKMAALAGAAPGPYTKGKGKK